MIEQNNTVMNADPRKTIDLSPMSLLQIFIIALTVGLNALDGVDVLSISLAAPDIGREWLLGDTAIGFLLSMELIGMGIGSIALGWVADTTGRRKTMIGCLVMMAIGMFMVTESANFMQLSIWRIVTGLGIGGLLAAITAITAEFSNLKNRALCISIMAIGYPIGGIVGSKIAGWLLGTYGEWRLIFYFGAAVTTFFIPLFYFTVPESIHWLVRKQPAGALDKVNKTLKRIGHSAITMLPEVTTEVRKKILRRFVFTRHDPNYSYNIHCLPSTDCHLLFYPQMGAQGSRQSGIYLCRWRKYDDVCKYRRNAGWNSLRFADFASQREGSNCGDPGSFGSFYHYSGDHN